MNNYKLQEIDKNTILLLPIDYQIPLSVIIEDFNMKNEKLNGTVLMDLFIYVGNKKNRYKSFSERVWEDDFYHCSPDDSG